jgi:predicted lysophospholipase L1 biosynthesis ABC-type transport system permease subunit
MVSISEASMADYRPGGGPVLQSALAQLDGIGISDRTTISLGQVDVGGEAVAAVGIGESTGSAPTPPIVQGRAPRARDEIVLGANTLQRLGASVGDTTTVSFGSSRQRMRIVGQATFPRLAEYPGAPNTGLGEGALLPSSTLSDLTGALPYTSLLVQVPDAAAGRALRHAYSSAPSLDSEADVSLIERPQRPDALYGYESTATVRRALAYLLGGLTVASVWLGLVAATRAARRELAVLRTIGLTRRQIRSVVHLHGVVVAVTALLVGVPLGLASGRAGWRAFATHLGVATDPVTPAVAVSSTAAFVVAVCVALTIPIAVAAIHHQPAAVLRAE